MQLLFSCQPPLLGIQACNILRQHYLRHLSGRLPEYGVTEEQLKAGDVHIHRKVTAFILNNGHERKAPDIRGFRPQARYYSEAEDKAMVDFIQAGERWGEVGGVALWKLMARKRLLRDRSWQSMKERFRKRVIKRLPAFGVTRLDEQEQGEEDQSEDGA